MRSTFILESTPKALVAIGMQIPCGHKHPNDPNIEDSPGAPAVHSG